MLQELLIHWFIISYWLVTGLVIDCVLSYTIYIGGEPIANYQ